MSLHQKYGPWCGCSFYLVFPSIEFISTNDQQDIKTYLTQSILEEHVSESELQLASECKKPLQAKIKISLGKEYRYPDKMCGDLFILPDNGSTKSPDPGSFVGSTSQRDSFLENEKLSKQHQKILDFIEESNDIKMAENLEKRERENEEKRESEKRERQVINEQLDFLEDE